MAQIRCLLFIPVLISFFQIATAQQEITPGKFILGGSFNFLAQENTYPLSSLSINSGIGGIFSNSIDDSRNTSFAITPYIGKEINPGLILGVQLDYRSGNYKADDTFIFGQPDPVDFKRVSNQIGIGLFSRHMFNPEAQFNLFIQPYAEYNFLKEEESQDSNLTREEKARFIEIGLGGGVLYNVSDHLRLLVRTGGITYVNGNWEIVGTDTEKDFSSFGASLNLSSIFLGVEFRL